MIRNIGFISAIVVITSITVSPQTFAQTTTVQVSASSGCISTINVQRGESIQFSAIGEATYGYEGSPVNSQPLTNADGDRFVNGRNIGKKIDPNALLATSIGSLIGKVDNSDYFLIGSGNQIVMPASGTLYLCYNDVQGGLGDNEGSYTVSIYRR